MTIIAAMEKKKMTNEFILEDRIQKIQQIINKYDEKNFFVSYSGGQDSNVLHKLIDLALPDNKIPRVYSNTGIEYKAIVDFVKQKAEQDDRFEIITPKVPIKQMLEEQGYPFKSKSHSRMVYEYQKNPNLFSPDRRGLRVYVGIDVTKDKKAGYRPCPQKLLYQFRYGEGLDFKVSDKCCHYLKVEPLDKWKRERERPIAIIGIMKEEGGRRSFSNCLAFSGSSLKAFQPLVAVTKEWEKWFIDKYEVDLPILYYPPYNFERTGCKGCPFALDLQNELGTLEQYFPSERKQCEIIWKPVYDEYRRIGYRLKK